MPVCLSPKHKLPVQDQDSQLEIPSKSKNIIWILSAEDLENPCAQKKKKQEGV